VTAPPRGAKVAVRGESTMHRPGFYEFFAGGGMARAGLGESWRCLFANDFDPKKAASYRANWGSGEIHVGDIHALAVERLPGHAALAWASFPCQDLSLAGQGAGLGGKRSGAFWAFRGLIDGLGPHRRPRLLVIENVVGALTSNGGADFAALCRALCGLGYVVGAVTVDAAHFLPQSRPRVFIVCAHASAPGLADVTQDGPSTHWHSAALRRAVANLPLALQASWRWWRLPAPEARNMQLIDVIEDEPSDVRWHEPEQTARIIALMSDANRRKLDEAIAAGARAVGAIYRRTRSAPDGEKIQRAEVRFDGLAGCLRTPGGGSSRQVIMVVEGNSVRTRMLSGREAARLMGLPDEYVLPQTYTDACHLLGDGLAVPAVRFIARHLLDPLSAGVDSVHEAAE
jgi:DNA (cytosine-5)-methyltransferase 1